MKAARATLTVSCAKMLGISPGRSQKKMRPRPNSAISLSSPASALFSVPSAMTLTVAPSLTISFRVSR